MPGAEYHILEYVLAGVLGVCLGSFVSVLVCRLPVGKGVVASRSCCMACGRQLAWFELVPVLSFIVLRRRCRTCGSTIPWMYLVRELLMGGVFIALFYAWGWSIPFVRFGVLAVLLAAIAEIDYRHGLVPNALVLVGVCVGVCTLLIERPLALGASLLASLAAFGVLLAVRAGSRIVFGRIGLGMGDVKLVAMIALFTGWYSLWAFYLAALLGGVIGIAGMMTGRVERSTRIPFAPFIAAGVVCAAFVYPYDVLAWFY